MTQAVVIAHGLWAKVQSGQYIAAGETLSEDVRADIDRQTAKAINHLFRDLRVICSGWRQAWPDVAAYKASKQQWLLAFFEAGINRPEQLQFGLMRARQLGSPFIPSPGTFIEWCQPSPEMLGLPPMAAAFREACRNAHPAMAGRAEWSHDAVWHAAKECGFESLNRLATDLAAKLFERNYVIAVRRLVAGQPLQKMPLALPAKVAARSTPEVGRAALAALRAGRPRHAQA
ncbi:replication protein P [Pseudomonas sp. Marseille-P9899]|uniref:replication protein P n=1 Tax=Pseudomonas sp. Marseille-P9899 TaxID=2730401 RepID=UPI001588F432|nr:replication protein P [Pseudomonas sp. Marseille-P9899]